jgi:hypothetical protein
MGELFAQDQCACITAPCNPCNENGVWPPGSEPQPSDMMLRLPPRSQRINSSVDFNPVLGDFGTAMAGMKLLAFGVAALLLLAVLAGRR